MLKELKQSAIADTSIRIFPEAASEMDYIRQGDLYIYYLGERVPVELNKVEPRAKLVPGETKGSQHCLDSLFGICMYELKEPTPLDGPIISVNNEKGVTITHPEHGHVKLFAGGVFKVEYQRKYAEELKRVMD